MSNVNFDPMNSSKYSDSENTDVYQYPAQPDVEPTPPRSEEGENDPTKQKSRRRLAVAIGAGVAGLVAGASVIMGVQGGASNERAPEPREPGASAPAVPGETDPATAGTEKINAPEMIKVFKTAFEANVTNEIEADPAINFNLPSDTVALDVVDAVSDWAMTGANKENLAAFKKMDDSSVEADLSPDDFNTIPDPGEASELIADQVAAEQVKKDVFKNMDPEAVQLMQELNADNIRAYLLAELDATGELKQFTSELEPVAMTVPFNSAEGTHTTIKFAEVSTPNKYKEESDPLQNSAGQVINMIRVFTNEGGVSRIQFTEIPPAQPMEIVEPRD